MPMPVLLVFKEEIVRHLGVKFSSGNAGSKYSTITSECSMAYSAFEWNEIFHRGPYDKSDYHTERKIINHRNAELLYPNAISLDFAKQIIFRTIAHQDDVSTIWGIDRQDLLAALVKERFQWSNILGTQLIKTYDSGKVAENGYYYRNMYFEQTAPNDIQNRLKSNRLDKLGRDYYG